MYAIYVCHIYNTASLIISFFFFSFRFPFTYMYILTLLTLRHNGMTYQVSRRFRFAETVDSLDDDGSVVVDGMDYRAADKL